MASIPHNPSEVLWHPTILEGGMLEKNKRRVHRHVYPANGSVTCEMKLTSIDDLENAVAAARAALPAWRALVGDKRRDLMLKMARVIERHTKDLVELSTLENGCPSRVASYIAADAARKFRYFGDRADKIHGESIRAWGGSAHSYLTYEPGGVIGAVIPWNGPLFAATVVMTPELAAGNCMVVKVSELAPFSVMRLGRMFLEAGFPPGVVNILAGGADIGEALVRHPEVDRIQFVGGRSTAKKVLRTAADTLKPCDLELDGKSTVVVFADADLQDAAKSALSCAVSTSGHGFVNGTRLLVERPIYEPYLRTLQAIAANIEVGDPRDPTTIIGPVISEAALQRILSVIETAVTKDGARLIMGGARLVGTYAGGFYLPLTIIADVAAGAALAQNAVFGPVLEVTAFDTEEEAITLANGTSHGSGAQIYTQNPRRAQYVASRMKVGMVQVNKSGEDIPLFAR
jgi:aldehyde dehydrogenase (NAD+)